jgi:histidinol-phosphate aminotransferase
MLKLAESHLLSINPYVPGRSIQDNSSQMPWAKLGSNENCLGASVQALEAASLALRSTHLYPSGRRHYLIEHLAYSMRNFNIKNNQIALGNGSSELILDLVRALVSTQEAVLFPWPTFVMYRLATRVQGAKEWALSNQADMSIDLESMALKAQAKNLIPTKLIFLPNPNNPTGNYINEKKLDNFISQIPDDVIIVIDEAYREYVMAPDYPNALKYALYRPRTVVLRTFSKAYALAGLRIGYAIGDEAIISVLGRIRDPFNVNCVAQEAAIAALNDKAHLLKSIEHNSTYMPLLNRILVDAGFMSYPSVGNFIMAKKASFMPPIAELCERLYEKGVVVRGLKEFGLDDHIRVSVGTLNEILQLQESLSTLWL